MNPWLERQDAWSPMELDPACGRRGRPVAYFQPPCTPIPDDAPAPAASTGGTEQAAPHLTVIVAEDDEDVREIESTVLSDEGFDVVPLKDGAAVGEEVRRQHADLVLLDYMLPGKDGNAVLEELEQNAETAQVPVIVVSAHPRAVRMTPQVRRVLGKPFDLDELVHAVEDELVQRRRS